MRSSPLKRARRVAELVAATMFAVMFGAFLVQIFSRYVLDDPLSWTLEVCSISYVWIVFFASATIVDLRQHITFDMLYKTGRPGRQRWLAFTSTAALLAVFAAAFPETIDYIMFTARQHTLILHIRMDLVYSCFGIFMIGVIIASAVRLRRLFGHSWRDEI
jgi:TRAP-type C4-dicarboxylate transport system permease small subunit